MATSYHDVIVIGAGPAGLCAGLYTARARLDTVILEKMAPGGQLINTSLIEDYPGFESIDAAELIEKMVSHTQAFGAQILTAEVTEVYSDDWQKVVRTADGDEYRAGAVIISSGGTPTPLNIPGEFEYAGRGVSYCAVCDGAFFRDRVITVVGGGDSAVEEGLFLTRFASKLYLVHRRDKLRAQQIIQDRFMASPNTEIIWDTVADEIVGDDGAVTGMRLRNVKTGEEWVHETDGVFIFIGFDPNTDFIKEAVERDEIGYLIAGPHMETDVPGLFIAGDVRTQLTKQITTAVGDATTAAVAATHYLEDLYATVPRPETAATEVSA